LRAAGGDRVTAVHADDGLRERSSGCVPWGPCVRQFYAGQKISACCLVIPHLHDTTGCQTSCITGLTTGCIV